MENDKKAREFWITNPNDGYNGIYLSKPEFEYSDMYHVIEYSAYEAALQREEALIKVLELECGNRCAHQNPCNAREAIQANQAAKSTVD